MINKELEKFVHDSLNEDISKGDFTSLACINNNNISMVVTFDDGTQKLIIITFDNGLETSRKYIDIDKSN